MTEPLFAVGMTIATEIAQVDPGTDEPDVRNDPVPEDDPAEGHISPTREE